MPCSLRETLEQLGGHHSHWAHRARAGGRVTFVADLRWRNGRLIAIMFQLVTGNRKWPQASTFPKTLRCQARDRRTAAAHGLSSPSALTQVHRRSAHRFRHTFRRLHMGRPGSERRSHAARPHTTRRPPAWKPPREAQGCSKKTGHCFMSREGTAGKRSRLIK